MDLPAPQRRFEPAVIARLFAEPQRFAWFQAVRLVELWLRRRGVPRADLVANVLRFQNALALGFPASEIEAIEIEPDSAPGSPPRYVRITPAFMGLLGVHGALPLHYTERIAAYQASENDAAPRAFLDTLSTRSLTLFYEAWRKYRVELKYELHGHDAFLPLLLSLAGLGQPALRGRLADTRGGAVLDASLAYFAAAFQQRPASAVQIARVLSEYFGQPIVAEQFIGNWYGVPPAQQCALGRRGAVLGAGAMVGARVWQRDLRVRLVIGPLDAQRFADFLPGGSAARALHSLLSLFTGLALEYEIVLVLRARDVHGARLGGPAGAAAAPGRLGWDSYLLEGSAPEDRADLRYGVCTL